jgi:glycosyltransferase involved in cell wall biosynthesis
MDKRVLWVTDEIPDPDLGGGSIRQYHLLRRLADRASIDLLMVGELRDEGLRRSLVRITELPRPPVSDGQPTWRRRIHNLRVAGVGGLPSEVDVARPICEYLWAHLGDTSDYDIVQIEHEWFAPLLPRRRVNQWVITLHNLLSVRSRQLAAVAEKRRVRWLFQGDALRAAGFEQRIVERYDLTVAVSEEDAAALGSRTVVVPNGVDVDRFGVTPLPSEPRLFFSGSFNWEPNVDGAHWFYEHVFPRVRQQVPAATLVLVGRQPDQRTRTLGESPGVEAHFDVPSVVPHLQSARVAVVPLRMGSGTRLKALEAMAAGRPVAGTPIGLEGLGLSDGESAVVADDPEMLAARIVRLCVDDGYAQHLIARARRLVDERFSWDHVAGGYIDSVLSLPAERRSTGKAWR